MEQSGALLKLSRQHQAASGGMSSVWLMAIRPKTLILSLGPVLLAGVLASEMMVPVNWLIFPIILMSAGSIQAATNLWNDAADAGSGLDKASERLGPPRVTSLGLASARQVKLAAFAFLAIATLCGLYLVYIGGVPILVIGVVGILCAFGYSSGPYPISGSPFGEIFVILFFGIMSVMGSIYLLTGEWTAGSFWAGLYIGLPAAAVLTVNNHRDRVGDEKGGRKTLAILLGPQKTKRLYAMLLLISSVGLIHVFNIVSNGTISLASLVVSMGVMLFSLFSPIRALFLATRPVELNACLMRTCMFQLFWIAGLLVIQILS